MKFDFSLPIAIGADHAGFEYKQVIAEWLSSQGYAIKDFGTDSTKSVDYPDFAHPTAGFVAEGNAAFGILICGSANGVAITANKHKGIRAGLCWDNEVAKLTRLHNNANIICIPSRFVAVQYAQQMVETFMNTEFEGGRHAIRANKMACT